jgi:predicted glutamine amidotransferase
MCGIVGVVVKAKNGFIKQTEDSFFQMLFVDVLRGQDATGLIAVENNTAFSIAKSAESPEWFIPEFKRNATCNIMYTKGKAYIGHNRKKTIGAISDETAHPFVVDKKFAMVHNGTLHDHEKLANTAVDSEALAIHIYKHLELAGDKVGDVSKAFEEALGKVSGAYAIAAYDQVRNRVYLLRNKDRPLSLIETDNAWYFMSEPLMGGWILSRNDYSYGKLKIDHILEHQLIQIDLDDSTLTKNLITPKKSYSQPAKNNTLIIPMGGVTVGNGTRSGGKPFKGTQKEFDKWASKWLGKRISFWVDDFVEKNFPKTIDEDKETEVKLLGKLEEIDYWHTITADVDLGKLGIRFSEDIGCSKWMGIIEALSFNEYGYIYVHIEDGCKPMTKASTQMDFVKKAKEYRAELGKKTFFELVKMEESQSTLDVWQQSALTQEKIFRLSIKSVEDAVAKAKELGYTIEQKMVDGRLVYVNDEGRIYYESAVVVH